MSHDDREWGGIHNPKWLTATPTWLQTRPKRDNTGPKCQSKTPSSTWSSCQVSNRVCAQPACSVVLIANLDEFTQNIGTISSSSHPLACISYCILYQRMQRRICIEHSRHWFNNYLVPTQISRLPLGAARPPMGLETCWSICLLIALITRPRQALAD